MKSEEIRVGMRLKLTKAFGSFPAGAVVIVVWVSKRESGGVYFGLCIPPETFCVDKDEELDAVLIPE